MFGDYAIELPIVVLGAAWIVLGARLPRLVLLAAGAGTKRETVSLTAVAESVPLGRGRAWSYSPEDVPDLLTGPDAPVHPQRDQNGGQLPALGDLEERVQVPPARLPAPLPPDRQPLRGAARVPGPDRCRLTGHRHRVDGDCHD